MLFRFWSKASSLTRPTSGKEFVSRFLRSWPTRHEIRYMPICCFASCCAKNYISDPTVRQQSFTQHQNCAERPFARSADGCCINFWCFAHDNRSRCHESSAHTASGSACKFQMKLGLKPCSQFRCIFRKTRKWEHLCWTG